MSRQCRQRSLMVPAESAANRLCVFCLVLLPFLSTSAGATDWPAWRGPESNGSTSVGAFPSRWEEKAIAWKEPVPGKGSSSPIVWRDRIYLTTPADGQDAVMALDKSGKTVWTTRLGPATPPKHRSLGSSCNASPVTDGQSVYAYFKSGHLAALELDGKVRWQVNLTEQFGPERLFWDQGSSPVLTAVHVVLTRMHGGESWIAGFDKATGEIRWQQKRNYETPTENNNAYTTPVLFEHHGEPALLVWGADHLTAHRAKDGEVLWHCGGFNPEGTGFWPAIASPVLSGDMVVVPAGRDDRRNQARLHGIRLGGEGDVTGTHRAWMRDDMGVFVTSLAEYKGRVFLLRHRGEVVCLDPAKGKTIWSHALPQASAPYYASPLIAAGRLYAAREDGRVFVANVEGDFELLAENDLGEQIIASPVPAGDCLLVRGAAHLFAIASR